MKRASLDGVARSAVDYLTDAPKGTDDEDNNHLTINEIPELEVNMVEIKSELGDLGTDRVNIEEEF